MKILIITDISVFQFYRYIGYIIDILEKNLGSLKLINSYENIEKNSYIINNNRHFKVVL